jgi:hypothetical protein
VYLFGNDGTNIICTRYSATDLTGAQVMTVPTVTASAGVVAWTDGVAAYVVSSNSDTTSRKWTVSGTTFTADSTTTVTTNIFDDINMTFWDGTNAYYCHADGVRDVTIRKLTAITGATYTTYTVTNWWGLVTDVTNQWQATFVFPIDTARWYFCGAYEFYGAAGTNTSTRVILLPVSKPTFS